MMKTVNSLPLALVTVSLKGETLLDLALDRNAPGVYEFDVPQVLLDDANDLKLSIKGTNGALRSVYIIDSLTVQYRREMAARDDMLLANLDASGQDVVVGGFSMADASAYSLSPGFQPERLVGGGCKPLNQRPLAIRIHRAGGRLQCLGGVGWKGARNNRRCCSRSMGGHGA